MNQVQYPLEYSSFFKEAKIYLGLGKCQSQGFDAQIADTTIYAASRVMRNFSNENQFKSIVYISLGQRDSCL